MPAANRWRHQFGICCVCGRGHLGTIIRLRSSGALCSFSASKMHATKFSQRQKGFSALNGAVDQARWACQESEQEFTRRCLREQAQSIDLVDAINGRDFEGRIVNWKPAVGAWLDCKEAIVYHHLHVFCKPSFRFQTDRLKPPPKRRLMGRRTHAHAAMIVVLGC